jgi:hypothetical protein
LLVAVPATAAQVGQAVQVVSLVRGQLGGTTREIAVKDNVFSQEVIETAEDAATRLLFLDGTELSMGPSSVVTIDRYIFDPSQPSSGQLVMNVVSGVFDFASGSIPSSGYDIRTPFATIAVRGTRISIVALGDSQGVVVSEGFAQVTTAGNAYGVDTGRCLIIGPGGQVQVVDQGDECAEMLASVAMIDAVLAGIEPAAGPADAGGGGGSNDGQREDDDPLVFPETPASGG